MKKYLFLIAMALGVMVAATSCGGDKKTTDEAGSNETTEETAVVETVAEPEDNTLKPPFTITAEYNFDQTTPHRTYIIEVLKSGMYKGTEIEGWGENSPADTTQFEGRWTTTHRMVGENAQKVYEIHFDYGAYEGTMYIPDDGEMMYLGDWDDCENFVKKHQFVTYDIKDIKRN